ncbi:MAG TPA: PASTA domain-containing protein [Acidimicrobiia bacterium]|nr:PASTA domain-containing protein [Acidimicrobiia bacterium]
MPGSAVSDLAGRVLAGRYLLHGAVGTGASGRVYVAEDTRLRRRVAVKVLHAALAEDAAFLRRFRAEAQLAASLHHPHIVTVHDWGDDDLPFMVLELLEGGSLRSMLDQGTRLSVPQAARVGRDVASALEYAHARGVLHRDIKPANLLFDEHGIVRVADFGLARALAEASWTEPAGAVFGTARYASPEQARGAQLDARSDLYSLALVLVESVTGRLPFASDTTIGTLTARTLEPITATQALGPLEPVIERVGAINPNERYPDAGTMRQAIADAADALPPPAPLVLAGMVDRADPHPTRTAPERTAPFFDQDAIEILHADSGSPGNGAAAPASDPAGTRRIPGQKRWVPFVVSAVLVLTVGFAAAALAQVGSATTLPVPGLRGLTLDQAKSAGRAAGLDVVQGKSQSAPDPAGTVISQSPASGDFTGGRRVTVVVSSGPADVQVPSIQGAPWKVARQALDNADLLYVSNPPTHSSETVPAGRVLNVVPAPGKNVAPDTQVSVVLSSGHAPVPVPDVSGEPFAEAAQQLQAEHFVVQRAPSDDFSATIASGRVVGTDPPIDLAAPYGSTVVVHVSKGPDLVEVPDVTFETIEAATADLARSGLQVGTVKHYRPGGIVMSQDPTGGIGERVPRGSQIDLVLRSGGLFSG